MKKEYIIEDKNIVFKNEEDAKAYCNLHANDMKEPWIKYKEQIIYENLQDYMENNPKQIVDDLKKAIKTLKYDGSVLVEGLTIRDTFGDDEIFCVNDRTEESFSFNALQKFVNELNKGNDKKDSTKIKLGTEWDSDTCDVKDIYIDIAKEDYGKMIVAYEKTKKKIASYEKLIEMYDNKKDNTKQAVNNEQAEEELEK